MPESVERGAVKTQFALSIPNQYAGSMTRMAADAVQANGTLSEFRGLSDIYIFPYATNHVVAGEARIQGTDAFSGYTAVSAGPANQLSPIATNGLGASANDKWYTDITIPVATNAFLVYGRAPKAVDDVASGFRYGKVVPSYGLTSVGQTAADRIAFAHARITDSSIESRAEATELAALLTAVARAQGYVSYSAIAETHFYDPAPNPMAETYTEFIKLRSGSSENIRLTLEKLYNVCRKIQMLKPDGVGSKTLTEAICEVIETRLTPTAPVAPATEWTLAWQTDPQFPAQYNVPDGVTSLRYEQVDGMPLFTYQTTAALYGSNYAHLDAERLVYPVELYYMTNSPIRVSSAEQSDNVGTNNWADFIAARYTESYNKAVKLDTRSVAVVNELQYTVGRLDTYVKFATGTILDQKSNTVTFPVEGYPVTGLLIGGQKDVDWAFMPTGTNVFTVYDRDVLTTAKALQSADTYTQVSYTLLFQSAGVADKNAAVSSTNDEEVQVALELTNTGAAFYGKDGALIPAGGKFYLVGSLKLSANVTGTLGEHKCIFEQDYVTKAQFNIASLQNAFNVIPDLKVPEQELGMSVNLQWLEGVTINSTIE